MDSDYWSSRLAAIKRQYNLHHQNHSSQLDRLGIDDFEVEDEVPPDFPCPYCYEDFNIGSLCSHLEDEHPHETRATVCPLCFSKVARDMLSHITLQHGHLLKLQRCRRLHKVVIPNGRALSLHDRDFREAHLQVLLRGGGCETSNTDVSADPLLSSFILNFSISEEEDFSNSIAAVPEDSKNTASSHIWKPSLDPSLSSAEREKRMEQATGRASFVQDLLLSALL